MRTQREILCQLVRKHTDALGAMTPSRLIRFPDIEEVIGKREKLTVALSDMFEKGMLDRVRVTDRPDVERISREQWAYFPPAPAIEEQKEVPSAVEEERESLNRLIGGLPELPNEHIAEEAQKHVGTADFTSDEGKALRKHWLPPLGEFPKSNPSLGAALGQHVASAVLRAVEEEVSVIVEAMKREIKAQLEAHFEPAGTIRKFEAAAPRTTARKPTVLVAGLLPSQAGFISQEFGEVFDLRFFDASANLQQLKDMAKVDYAFTFTGKISHGVEEAIMAKGTPVRRCPGGMTMLREKLTELYLELGKRKEAA